MIHKKGFTLIEMLIVVAIIGILASVVLVGLGPVQRQGRDSRRVSDLRQVQTALELMFNKNGVYPGTGSMTWADLTAALTGAGIGVSNVPNDPKPGVNYQYASNGSTYVLGATLEETTSPQLNNDVDGTPIVGGVNCADPVYCVQL